jgi:hypothetical protein
MKKIYFKPETTTITVNAQPLMFGSDMGNGDKNGGGSKGDLGGNDAVLSRRGYSVWDDDDE